MPRPDLDLPIESKLHAPDVRAEWVPRPALLRQLAHAAPAKLVLVDAPPGFGKTTLVAQWRSSAIERGRFAWLSLDPGDDDPGRLWWHIVSALERACPELPGQDIQRALRAHAPDFTHAVIPKLAGWLAGLTEPVVLVLDDFHVIRDQDCHEQVASLLLHCPPSVVVVLITRSDPQLPLARLRAIGDMVEIRMRDLCFTRPEAAALVQAVSGIELAPADLADLVERTEGWPAGVYLAALSHAIRTRRDTPGVSPWATLEALLGLAQVHLSLGEMTRAGELLGDAQQMLAAFPDGVEALQGRLDGLGRQRGLPHVAASRGSALTGREVAVLQLLRGTLSLREIGLQLYVSPNTVKSHAQAIYRKLGVSTRHDAVARAHECGVL